VLDAVVIIAAIILNPRAEKRRKHLARLDGEAILEDRRGDATQAPISIPAADSVDSAGVPRPEMSQT